MLESRELEKNCKARFFLHLRKFDHNLVKKFASIANDEVVDRVYFVFDDSNRRVCTSSLSRKDNGKYDIGSLRRKSD